MRRWLVASKKPSARLGAEMDDKETEVMSKLAEAWNAYLELPTLHADDQTDFRQAIHQAQRIVASREYARQQRQAKINAILENRRAQA